MLSTPKKRIELMSSHTKSRRWFFAPTTWLGRVATTHTSRPPQANSPPQLAATLLPGGRQRRRVRAET